ncbi:PREDICTED: UBN2_3 domain-containing [Prunus dulcis]|uniref:PREDICTED: UBN2_3 domain-containing n=1 Tax=Prunus dulcis TaxID=3755 RepID=A0A5E4F4V3_PRUDU|nr:PREDICTED: UBN2_3 domain-containing [Prunus dulcis]
MDATYSNSTMKLSSILLNGLNYVAWSRAVTLSLGGKAKFGHINGKAKQPKSNDPKFDDWESTNRMVMSWLINSMEPEIRAIADEKQKETSFAVHLGNLKRMWNELAIYRPTTIDLKILQQRAEEDKLFELLANLKPEYEQLRSQILMCPTIPSLNNVCITIQREETRKKVMNSEVVPQESSALVADDNKKLIVDHLITTKRACV